MFDSLKKLETSSWTVPSAISYAELSQFAVSLNLC